MARVVLAMSGGVDSSVAAWLLREAGHEVIGVFMRHGVADETACATPAGEKSPSLPIVGEPLGHRHGCCTAADAADARRVADRLDIPFYAINFDAAFGQIIDYFVEEYTSARTPNPCVVCNNWIKFGRLLDYADGVGADYIATGHYARLVPSADRAATPALLRGRDADKDQSYVLFGIERDVLSRVLFPVGDYCKPEIRSIARQIGLRVADKHDSQEICFVPDGDYAAFVRCRMPADDRTGEIVTTAGEVVGRHEGYEQFTIGQRKGLGVALGEPRYVVRLEPQSRRVVIGTRDELARQALTAKNVNWLINPPRGALRCRAQIRYASRAAEAVAEPLAEGRLRVEFDQPQYGVAPGQAVVCYDGERVLGGGWIE